MKPYEQARREAIGSEPVEHIEDGWLLRCGCLYLHVGCNDGVTRTYVIERKNRLPHLCATYHKIGENA